MLLAAAVCAACSGGAPASPSPQPTQPAPSPPATITGHLTATNGGQPLPGVIAALGTGSGQTDQTGTVRLTTVSAVSFQLSLSGPSIVPRLITLGATASRDVAIDAFSTAGSFDLNYFRRIARDGEEQPANLQPLRRLTAAPIVYLRTVDDAGLPIDAGTLQTTETVIRALGGVFTGGAFGIADVQRGTETRVGRSGFLTVRWLNPIAENLCGRASVGQDGGVIDLNYLETRCACPGTAMQPSAIRHEFGHAFGLYHTHDASDLMAGTGIPCDMQPNAREQLYAKYLYRRMVGNQDPDTDPPTAIQLSPSRMIP